MARRSDWFNPLKPACRRCKGTGWEKGKEGAPGKPGETCHDCRGFGN